MPPSTDQVQSSTNQYRLILTQFLQVLTSSALYWPSATKYQPAFERISTCRSFLNLTTYKFISGVEFDQGYLSFFLYTISFRRHIVIIWDQTHTKKKSRKADRKGGGGRGSTLTISLKKTLFRTSLTVDGDTSLAVIQPVNQLKDIFYVPNSWHLLVSTGFE